MQATRRTTGSSWVGAVMLITVFPSCVPFENLGRTLGIDRLYYTDPATIAAENRARMLKLKLGMVRDAALAVMGNETWHVRDFGDISNPFKFESAWLDDQRHAKIYSYITSPKGTHQLSHLVFVDDHLVAWGDVGLAAAAIGKK